MTRKIIHLDLDAFYCAVEEQRDPALRGKAFAVGGRPQARGVVASCSYPARRHGVRSAMPMSRAVRLCPRLLIVAPHFKRYTAASHRVMAHLRALTPLVEQLSIDEAFLDVSELSQPATHLAKQLQATIRNELDLPCSLGVAANKLVAKIANNVGKAVAKSAGPPNALQVVPAGQEAAFLAPLPVAALWGVGPKTAERLNKLGLHTIGDIAQHSPADLARRFGQHGRDLARRAQGIDNRPVVAHRQAKSISQETTFARDTRDPQQLYDTLSRLSEQVGRQLRAKNMSGSTVKLKLRWPDFTTITRQTTLSQPTDQDALIYRTIIRLFEREWQAGRAIRLLGVGVSGLAARPRQLHLWDDWQPAAEKTQRLNAALDQIRTRFGEHALQRGNELEREDEQ